MTTCTELDTRLKDLYPNYKQVLYGTARLDVKEFIDMYRNQELVGFTNDLHDLLVSEGFDSTYDPTDVSTAQDIWLYMSPGRVGIIRVTIRYDGWVYVDCDSDIPYKLHGVLNGAAPIKELTVTLQEIRRLITIMPPCRSCHYSNYSSSYYSPDSYCGKGLVPVHGCTGYRPVSATNNQYDRR